MTNAIRKSPGPNGIFHYVINVDISGYPSVDWEQDPNVTAVTTAGVSQNYWKYDGSNTVVEMTQAEKDNVDLLLSPVAVVNGQGDTQLYTFNETFTSNEVKIITLPTALPDTFVNIFNPATVELNNEILL